MSSRDSSLALNRTEIGVLLPRPGGDFGAPDRMPPTAVPDDVGDVAADADAEVEPDRLLLLPLALLVALLAFGNLSESMAPAPTLSTAALGRLRCASVPLLP